MGSLHPTKILIKSKMIKRFISTLSRNRVPAVSSILQGNICRCKSSEPTVLKPKVQTPEDLKPKDGEPSILRHDDKPSEVSSKPKIKLPKDWNTPEFFKKERYKDGEYPTDTLGNMKRGLDTEELKEILSEPENVKAYFQALPGEFTKLKEHIRERIRNPPVIKDFEKHIEMLFTFDTQEKIDNFNVTTDADHDVGHSTASLKMTKSGSALFSGYLCNRLKPDGQTMFAGYVNTTCKRPTLPFWTPAYLNTYHDFEKFNHFVFKVRGDGRTYAIILNCTGDFEDYYGDQFTYFLYTRGGPYWQISKIPFSKFFHAPEGHINIFSRENILQTRITRLGITLADCVEGPFSLEIDYIGLQNKLGHTEELAYELYHHAGPGYA